MFVVWYTLTGMVIITLAAACFLGSKSIAYLGRVITITCNPGSSASGWGWCVNLDTDHLGRLKHSITWFWSFSFRVDAWYTDSTSNILQALAQILRWVRVIAANGVRQPELRFTERADRIPAFQENFWIYPWLYYWVCFCHEALKTAIRVITIFV